MHNEIGTCAEIISPDSCHCISFFLVANLALLPGLFVRRGVSSEESR